MTRVPDAAARRDPQDLRGEAEQDHQPDPVDEPRDPDPQVRKVTLPAEAKKTIPQRVADAQAVDRAPIIPAWVKTSDGRRSTTRGALNTAAYTAGFHTIRAPWYLGKVVVLAPIGALKLAESVRRFVFDHAGKEMRLKVAASNDPKMHALLVRQRDAIVGRRLAWVATLAIVLSVVYVLAWWLLPAWAVWGIWAGAAVALARHGAPAAHPLVAQSVVRRGPPPITDFSMARALTRIFQWSSLGYGHAAGERTTLAPLRA
jgi:S-DNA-T family DNA segregation ATPase FtsK/SpoIIIE